MSFSKKIIPKQFFHVILWITNEYVICDFREINSPILFSCNWNAIFREITSENKKYVPLHTNITESIPKQFRFGNSSTQITEYYSQNISVR